MIDSFQTSVTERKTHLKNTFLYRVYKCLGVDKLQKLCCLSVILWLDKGDFPENVHTACPC